MKNYKRLISWISGCTSLVLVLAWMPSASAADWGSLSGRFVLDGDLDEPKAINVTKDAEFCGKHPLVDETVVVGENGALTNVLVYLYVKRGKSVSVHPDLEEASSDPAVLDNKGCRFEPHVLLVRTSQPFEIRNSDAGIGHNTNATTLSNPPFNELVTNNSPLTKTFAKSESYPSPIACNVHPWMKAYVLIRDNPYMAVSGQDGTFKIENIPAGEHEFIFWHEAKGNMRKLSVGGTKTSRKGRAKLKIPAGETLDLGEIKVAPSVLGK